MALAHVQSEGVLSAGAVASVALTLDANVTAGNLLVAGACAFDIPGDAAHAISDSLGNTFTAHTPNSITNGGNFGRVSMWWDLNSLGGSDTITFDPGPSNDHCSLAVSEHSGQDTAGTVVEADGNGNNNSPVTGNMVTDTTTTVIGVLGLAQGVTVTTGTNFTQRYYTGDTDPDLHLQDRVGVASGTYTASWSLSGGTAWACLAAAFEEGGGGPAPCAARISLLGAGCK